MSLYLMKTPSTQQQRTFSPTACADFEPAEPANGRCEATLTGAMLNGGLTHGHHHQRLMLADPDAACYAHETSVSASELRPTLE